VIIETERLILRPTTLDDAEAAYHVNKDPEVNQYTGEGGFDSIADVAEILKKSTLADYVKYGFGRMAVVYKPENKYIGFSGLKYLPELDTVDIGYRFAKKYWGMGIATESARPFIKYGFETLNLKEIIGLTMPENKASSNVLKKLGFKYEGMVEYFDETCEKYIIFPKNG
jgi:RimJ/RimL family protein N-acetyltransferase